MRVRIRLIRARPNFYIISENPFVSLGIVDCSQYTRRVMLKEDYQKNCLNQIMLQLSRTTSTWKHWQRHVIPERQNQFIQEKIFNSAPIPRTAIAMNSKSAFTGSFAENPFSYQQFNPRDIRILRGGQPIAQHDTTDNCRLYVTTKKAMNFQGDIPSNRVDNFKDQYLLVFDLTSIQDATEHCGYPELIGEPLRFKLYFSSPL